MQKSQPDFLNTIEGTKNNVSANLYTHNIGRIIQFYPATQTADVELMQVKEYNGQLYPSTILSKIPVIVYGSANAQITLPDLTNTICLILTFDRNVSAFMKTGESYQPDTSRKHNITDSIALTTFFSLNNPIQSYDTDAITLRYKKVISDVVYYSIIQNLGNSILLKVSDTTNNTYSQISLTNKVNIKNNQNDLLTLLNGLINVIKAITITSNAVSSASQTALEDYKTEFGKLLN